MKFRSQITVLFLSSAFPAMAQEGAPQGGLMDLMFPMLLMFGVIYFLIIRPQKKQTDRHQQFLKSMKKGDEVVTSGGIIGKVTGIADNVLTVEIADKTKIKVLRSHVHKPATPKPAASVPAKKEATGS